MSQTDTETMRVDVWSDFVCPFCLIGQLRLQRLAKERPLTVHWHAFMLRPPGSPPVDAARRAMIESHRPQLRAMVKDEFGIELADPPIDTSTLHAHLLHKYAERQGKGPVFHEATLRAYWLEGRAIGDDDVLAELAVASGLEADALDKALQDEASRRAVDSDLGHAQAIGIGAVPSFVFAERLQMQGAQPYEVFVKAAAEAARMLGAQGGEAP
jgi:predicted DsbA family dithiol-disulfide isomerase